MIIIVVVIIITIIEFIYTLLRSLNTVDMYVALTRSPSAFVSPNTKSYNNF